jgi:hypothetical protein
MFPVSIAPGMAFVLQSRFRVGGIGLALEAVVFVVQQPKITAQPRQASSCLIAAQKSSKQHNEKVKIRRRDWC